MQRPVHLLIALLVVTSARADDVPNLQITPGAVRAGLSKQKICSIKWGKDERHVTDAMKQEVFAIYGYTGYDDPDACRQASAPARSTT